MTKPKTPPTKKPTKESNGVSDMTKPELIDLVGQLNEALDSYSKGAKVDPTQQLFAGKMNLGRCKVLLRLQRFKEAIDACSDVMTIPEDRYLRVL